MQKPDARLMRAAPPPLRGAATSLHSFVTPHADVLSRLRRWGSLSRVHRLPAAAQDRARMDGYRDAILKNRVCFKDKVVLDVGTGSGILAIWAAQAQPAIPRIAVTQRSSRTQSPAPPSRGSSRPQSPAPPSCGAAMCSFVFCVRVADLANSSG